MYVPGTFYQVLDLTYVRSDYEEQYVRGTTVVHTTRVRTDRLEHARTENVAQKAHDRRLLILLVLLYI